MTLTLYLHYVFLSVLLMCLYQETALMNLIQYYLLYYLSHHFKLSASDICYLFPSNFSLGENDHYQRKLQS